MTSTLTTRRLRAVFLRPLHSRSHRLQQTKNATGRAQTRVFAGLGAFFGKEPDREQREKTEPNGPEMGAVRRMPLKRPAPGTAPTLALRAEKNPTDKGWVFRYWWRRGDLNPRPRTRNFRYYMFRLVFNLMGVQPTARQPAHDSAKFDCLAADALNSGSVKMPLNLNVQTHSSERQRELSR